MALNDIEKLKEKVAKDLNSKFFVPLAEEYRKEGKIDEAIKTLLTGIESQPGYMSARVSLGKIYLEKGMLNEARDEFEQVVKSIPDNLYAHKKLAEIYKSLGNRPMAIRSYKSVLKLNAIDEDALHSLELIEREEEEFLSTTNAGPVPSLSVAVTPAFSDEFDVTAHNEDIAQKGPVAHAKTSPPVHQAEDLNAFKDSLFGMESAGEENIEVADLDDGSDETAIILKEEESLSFADFSRDKNAAKPQPAEIDEAWALDEESLEEVSEVSKEEIPTLTDNQTIEEEGLSFADFSRDKSAAKPQPAEIDEAWALDEESFEEVSEVSKEEIPTLTDNQTIEEEGLSFADFSRDKSAAKPQPAEIDEAWALDEESFEEVSEKEIATPAKSRKEYTDEKISGSVPSLADADSKIAGGDYIGAIRSYKSILAQDPSNKNILQRIEELKGLLKMLGKDKDLLIAKLDSFGDGIRKRRDEFLGHS